MIATGIGYVCSRFIHFGNVEFTDDAQVRQQLTPVNSRVQGFVSKVCFKEFQQVRKGDTLVVIEDSEYRLRWATAKNAASLGTTLDSVTTHIQHLPATQVYGQLMEQVMAVSIKELWGWTIVAGILLFLLILLSDSPVRAALRRLPKRLRRG